MKTDHLHYVEKMKKTYESEIYEIRLKNSSLNFDSYREKIFTDLHQRVMLFVQERHQAYVTSYCSDHQLTLRQIDPVELLIYIVSKLQGDNHWLVDKLAEAQDEKRRILDRSQIQLDEQELLNSPLFAGLLQQTQATSKVMEGFIEARDSLMQALSQTSDKENVPSRRHNYNSSTTNMRESIQSMKSMQKSSSGFNLMSKYQSMKYNESNKKQAIDASLTKSNDFNTVDRSATVLGESTEFYREN